MLIYKDILAEKHDEIMSDSFPMKLVDGVVYEVDAAMVTIGKVNVDTGANASAEEAEETLEDEEVKVNNIIHSFSYQKTSFDKKSYSTYIKSYLKAIASKLQENGESEEEIDTFKKGAAAYLKEHILGKFNDIEFYTGENMDPEGMVILLNYREDGITPYFMIWKHGLKEEKV